MTYIIVALVVILVATVLFGVPAGFALTVAAMLTIDLRFAVLGWIMLFGLAVYLIYKEEVEEL